MRPTPEQQLAIVRPFVRSRCWNNSEWDAGDLEGKILEDLTRWPPRYPAEVMVRCKFAYADWQKKRMGGVANKPTYDNVEHVVLEHQLTPTLTVAEVTPGDLDVALDWWDELDEPFLQQFAPAEQAILVMLVEGYSKADIARQFGVTRAAICKRVAKIKPRLAELLFAG